MGAFTQADVDSVNQALKDLGNGKRRVSVTWSDSGGTRTVQYDKTTITDLIKLRDMMVAEMQATSSPKRTRSMFTTTVKGL